MSNVPTPNIQPTAHIVTIRGGIHVDVQVIDGEQTLILGGVLRPILGIADELHIPLDPIFAATLRKRWNDRVRTDSVGEVMALASRQTFDPGVTAPHAGTATAESIANDSSPRGVGRRSSATSAKAPMPDDEAFLETARRVCTRAELDALAHALAGHGQLRTALALGISRRSVRDRLDNAYRKIARAQKGAHP